MITPLVLSWMYFWSVDPTKCFGDLYAFRSDIAERERSYIHLLFNPHESEVTAVRDRFDANGVAIPTPIPIVPVAVVFSHFEPDVSVTMQSIVRLLVYPKSYSPSPRLHLSSNQSMQLTAFPGTALPFVHD
jgi:hypothetical protein